MQSVFLPLENRNEENALRQTVFTVYILGSSVFLQSMLYKCV